MGNDETKGPAVPATADGGRASVLIWAKESRVSLSVATADLPERHDDLKALGPMIGDAEILALSEAVHGGAEPLEFRNRLFEYLVEEKGFTAIAIESGIVESRRIHDYVRGAPDDLDAVLAAGISWTFDRLSQNRELVRWLKEYNDDPHHAKKLNFYGFDVPGSPSDSYATRGMNTALIEALSYVETANREAAAAFRQRLGPFLADIRFDSYRPTLDAGYYRLSEAERDKITAAIADLISSLEIGEASYTAATSSADYAWGLRAAIGARQADGWLRNMPMGWRPLSGTGETVGENTRFLSDAGEVRDRAQADNVEWIVQQEGARGKILLFAHRNHVSAAAIHTNWLWDSMHEVMGTYLRRRFGKRLLTIGNLIGRGEVECAGPKCCDGTKQTLGDVPRDSIEEIAAEIGESRFMLDLRVAPDPVARWLEQTRPFGRGVPGRGWDMVVVSASKAFDILFYMDVVTSECCGESSVHDRPLRYSHGSSKSNV